jgi:hypothetical protein
MTVMVETHPEAYRALQLRTRRVGTRLIAAAPLVGVAISLLSGVIYGVLLGALTLLQGVYVRFLYARFARWLRRREQPR